ncbi:transposase [Methylomonas sp. LL1]|uniref:transposase n=1 Tax=Methylomonas sp. LL1 TaxID=2785785 RepID=UPI0018C3BEF3|nr:transposase [Methylomonas sp. LL1]
MQEMINHPNGEAHTGGLVPTSGPVAVDTFGGRIHVDWNPDAAVTPLGQLPFFIEFLHVSGLFEDWVAQCPLTWSSPNAPLKRDVLGTVLLSVLSGHQRYAHINALRGDGVNPDLLGMSKVVSEDSVRRSFARLDEETGSSWLQTQLQQVYAPVLGEPWILDADATIKTLYGQQEGAEVGYNPHKPGRPSHTYHSYMIANLRLILDVEVQTGKKVASKHSSPGLWALLNRIPRAHWPTLIRGDRDWGTEANMQAAEQAELPYLFKLRLTQNTRRLIERLMLGNQWTNAGQGWQAAESKLRLTGWSRARRIVVLRRQVKKNLAVVSENPQGPKQLSFAELSDDITVYEYSVLVTSLEQEALSVAQLYRDRADAENNFDELKNHWAWGGFTTQDIKRCRFMAKITALIYNWWSLFVRLAHPEQHTEAITSRPLMLYAIAKQTRHAGQTRLTISSPHAQAEKVEQRYRWMAAFFKELRSTAEQLTSIERWCRILSLALVKYLRGRQLRPPNWLPAPT